MALHAVVAVLSRFLLGIAAAATVGCASIGPPSVARDRFDYVASISESWKRQMLQNLVKIRYTDVPVFLDVTTVITAYSLDSQASIGGQIGRGSLGQSFATLDANAAYADKPTITYTPLSGDKFARNLVTPLPVSSLLYVVQGGHSVSWVFRACVTSINGLENAFGGVSDPHGGDAAFAELLAVMQQAQVARAFGIRPKSAADQNSVVMYFRDTDGAGGRAVRRIRELLGLDPKALEFDVVYGAFPTKPTEIAILSRSAMQILVDFASYIDVAPAEVADGRVFDPARSDDQLRVFPPLLRVRTGETAPANAYIGARYRDQWFWIDDRDEPSKRALSALMVLFSLTETGTPQPAPPVVTIPAR